MKTNQEKIHQPNTCTRHGPAWLRWLLLPAILLLAGWQWSAGAATITTDKLDYMPGETVTFSGDGWAPGETVFIDIYESPSTPWVPRASVSAVAGAESSDTPGSFVNTDLVVPESWLNLGFIAFATGQTSGLQAETTFTDSAGSYTLKWYAADPAPNKAPYLPTYQKLPKELLECTVVDGKAADPLANAVAYADPPIPSNLDAVTSLMPKDMALCQIVPFFLEIDVTGSTSPEIGVITVYPEWLAKTTKGQDFGFDPSVGLYCAFVDTADHGTFDPGANAKVSYYTSTTLETGTSNERIRGTVQVSGLDQGDNIIVELWVALKCDIPVGGANGNVQTGLESAHTGPANQPDDKINVGGQTVPLLQVSDFTKLEADVTLTKTATPQVCPGGLITYTLTAANNSSTVVANGVNIVDTLPAGVTFVSAEVNGTALEPGSYSISGNTFTYPAAGYFALAPLGVLGNSLVLKIVAIAPSSVPAPPTLVNSATANVTVTIDPTPANNTASATTTVNPLPTCSITPLTPIIGGQSASFEGPADMDSYEWTVAYDEGDPSTVGGNAQTLDIVIPVDALKVTVGLTVTDNGCTKFCPETFDIVPPAGCIVSLSEPGCPAGLVTYRLGVGVPTPTGATVEWSVDFVPAPDDTTPPALGTVIEDRIGDPPRSVTVRLGTCGYYVVHVTITRGNSPPQTCSETGYVVDETPPQLFGCPVPEVTLECDEVIPEPAEVTASDTCAGALIPVYTETETVGTCENKVKKTVTRTWTVVDTCGNLASCSQVITIVDTTAPVITVPPAALIMACYDAEAVADWLATATATDNCDGTVSVTPTFTPPADNCDQVVTVTFTATDDCGNESTATKTFTVDDTTAPEITCPPDYYGNCLNNTCSTDPKVTGMATATDNCGGNVTITYRDSTVPDPDSCKWTVYRTWTAEDDCGNKATCVQTISCVPLSEVVVTDSGLCAFDWDPFSDCREFRLLFRTGTGGNYELTASNPGQTYFNVFYIAPEELVGEYVTFTVNIPYPYVTQGANPIHVYDGVEIGDAPTYCLTPGNAVSDWSASQKVLTLDQYVPVPDVVGSVVYPLDVTVKIPGSGFVYLNIHLDYGLKKQPIGYTKGDANLLDEVAASNDAVAPLGFADIPDLVSYLFSVSGTFGEDPNITPITWAGEEVVGDAVCSINSFKKCPGVGVSAGKKYLTFDGVEGVQLLGAGYKVELRTTKNALLTSGTTDEDGHCMMPYKWTGKATTLRVLLKTPDGKSIIQSKDIVLKANGLVYVAFEL